jgi:hypothetical protein
MLVHTHTAQALAHDRVTEAPAHARELPGLYLGAMAGPWHGPSVRPAVLPLGADWTIDHLRWASWSQQGAAGRGYQDACMGPAGGPPCDSFWATVTAAGVRQHDGSRYFTVMKLTSNRGRVEWLVMNTGLGWWNQRSRP